MHVDMHIGAVDPDHVPERDQRDWHELNLAVRRADHPDDPLPAFGHSARLLLPPAEGSRSCWFARNGAGRLLGGVVLTRHGHENAHLANVDVRVHPDARRSGVGRALFGAARSAVAGTTELYGFARTEGAGAGFATALGFARGDDGLRNLLDTDRVDRAEVARLAAGAAARTEDVSLVRWLDRCPDEFVDAYAAAQAGMNDARVGTVGWQPVRQDAGRVRRVEAQCRRWGGRHYLLAVRENTTGVLAGTTEVTTCPGSTLAEQGDTSVLAGFRGRGFGLWLKAAMLVWLAEAEPHLTRYETFNAAGNRHMIAVNERLGYRTVEVWCEWSMRLG